MKEKIFIFFLCFMCLMKGVLFSQVPLRWFGHGQFMLDSGKLVDLSAHAPYMFFSSEDNSNIQVDFIHFQPCLCVNNGGISFNVDSLILNRSFYLFMVYARDGVSGEMNLWSLQKDSSFFLKMKELHLIEDFDTIRHTEDIREFPYIHFLGTNWLKQRGKMVFHLLDSNFSGKFCELIIYNKELSLSDIQKIHTYLALRYGITLDSMMYVNGKGEVIWPEDTDYTFSHEIAGIGYDSLLGVHQLEAAGLSGYAEVVLYVDTLTKDNGEHPLQLNHEGFILWGSNGKNISLLETGDSILWYSEKIWKIKVDSPFYRSLPVHLLLYRTFNWPGIPILTIYRNNSLDTFYYPQVLNDSVVLFQNIYWDIDTSGIDYFTFVFVRNDSLGEKALRSAFNVREDQLTIANQHLPSHQFVRIFPNPNRGNFQIEVIINETASIDVEVIDVEGRILQTFQGLGSSYYCWREIHLPQGAYLIKVKGFETQVYRVIVK